MLYEDVACAAQRGNADAILAAAARVKQNVRTSPRRAGPDRVFSCARRVVSGNMLSQDCG
eukprot:2340880-Alexandrium_andersonii.AAC.1